MERFEFLLSGVGAWRVVECIRQGSPEEKNQEEELAQIIMETEKSHNL